MSELGISESAVLIGFNPEGDCVYSAIVPLSDYWDSEHVWDSGEGVIRLRLRSVQGFLFDDAGVLLQQFESFFDIVSGALDSAWARHADGTIVQGPPRG